MMQLDWVDLLYVMLAPWLLAGGLWLLLNHKRIPDKINLLIPSLRARAVKVNMHTRAGRNLELVRIPDSRGIIHWNGGAYVYNPDLATQNARLRIPEISFIEGQPHAFYSPIGVLEAEMDVEVPQEDGTLRKEKRKVPTYVLNFRKTTPEKLRSYTAQEIETALNNKIVQDIITATSNELSQIKLVLILTICTLAATIIGAYLLYADVQTLREMLVAQAQLLSKRTVVT